MFRFKIIITNVIFDYLAGTPVLKVILKKLSIGIDFGIGIDQNGVHGIGLVSYRNQKSWYGPSLSVTQASICSRFY